MKLKSVKSIMILSKRAIVMGINDHFRKMSKKQLAIIYYGLLKSKLPRLRVTKRKALPATPTELQRRQTVQYWQGKTKRKTKRKTKKIVGKIYYTKKGQPYKILASGKARFVKK